MVTTSKESFKLDDFQKESIKVIGEGHSVIVCAPTGAGKTVIAKEAIRLAIATNKKVFYTAPLKALINQKYAEFCDEFGADKVGIITGDTNKNRDSQIIVMTTEIYRNMLYGTTFGSIDPFLEDLQYLIFDEFHYINDPSRGTVWEESVIYSPKKVQIVALSATINNPEELVNWIQEIHGECKLVQTDFRPVPLHHFYFKDDQMFPLLTTNGKLNPKLKERSDNRLGKRKGKFGNRDNSGNNNKTSISSVVKELNARDMLPAIYFVFSRKGCDMAVKDCRDINLLNKEEATKLNHEIDIAIAHNAHLANFNQLDLLRKGIAAHHAGMLPQIKALIEDLFSQALVKVVFSTETLAAGINMPAKATVINNMSKATDKGFRTLKSSEFMQMSGRAGRRGMDEAGYVVTVKNGNFDASEVAFLVNSKAEDIDSHFNASYEMVLNLLQGHSHDEVKNLIQKSFGQSLINKHLGNGQEEQKRLEEAIIDLQHPLCPGDIGDLNFYKEMHGKLDVIRTQKKLYEKKMDPRVDELEDAIEILAMEVKSYPCNGCPKQKPCSKQMEKIKRYRKQSKVIESKVESDRNELWYEFSKVIKLLQAEGYLDEKYHATERGRSCAAIRSDNSYFITELLESDVFKGIEPKDFPNLLSCFVIGEGRNRDRLHADTSKVFYKKEKNIQNVSRKVINSQRQFGIYKSVTVNANLSGLIQRWAEGCEWDELVENSGLDDGDILRGIRRTLDMTKQISKCPNISHEIQNLANDSIALIERDIVLDAF
ncbi:MAG: DEAD/DEAH box helicase [Cyanobacteria bacterium]|nr:DEAD/DEAH box helicase [Cyanobacteriota bacterium]